MRKTLFFLALLASNIAAAEWKPSVTGHNLTGYVDPDSIRKHGDGATMRVLVDYKTHPFDGNNLPYLSTLMLVEYDCKVARFRALETTSFAGHMATGHRPYISHEPGAWKPVTTKTIQDTLWNIACGELKEQEEKEIPKTRPSASKP